MLDFFYCKDYLDLLFYILFYFPRNRRAEKKLKQSKILQNQKLKSIHFATKYQEIDQEPLTEIIDICSIRIYQFLSEPC